MTLEIQNPRAGQALTDAFDLKGRVRPELEEYVVPVCNVADLTAGAPPAVQRTATAYFSQAAVGGQRACFQMIVPGGTLARIRRVSFFSADSLAQPDAWFLLFSAQSAALGKPASQANTSFTDGRLQQTGVVPSAQVWFGTKVSTLTADWALPLFYQDQTTGASSNSYEPTAGWVVGSGVAGVSSYLEGAFDEVNEAQTVVIEWEEFQVG